MRTAISALALAIGAALAGTATAAVPILTDFDVWQEAGAVKREMQVQIKVPSAEMKALAGTAGPSGFHWIRQSLPSEKRVDGDDPAVIANRHLEMLTSGQGKSAAALSNLRVASVSRMHGGAALVEFDNRVNGVEIFRESLGMLIGKDQSLVALRGRLPDSHSEQSKANVTFQIGERDAALLALEAYGFLATDIGSDFREVSRQGDYFNFAPASARSASNGAVLSSPLRVKPVLFRHPSNGLRPAYYVETQIAPSFGASKEYFAHVFDAQTGELLFRMFQEASEVVSYRVFAENTGPKFWPHPSPHGRNDTPHPTGTPGGLPPAFVAPALIALQNTPFSQSATDFWLPNGASVLTGNNADGYLDIAAPDGFGAGDIRPTSTAPATYDRVFDTAINASATTAQRMAAATYQFYMVNWLHDDFYDAGFAEADGNAQANNFGRGGVGGDAILAEGQDNSGRNNANMATPADGGQPVMQMFLFDGVGNNNFTLQPAGTTMVTAGANGFGPQIFDVTAQIVQATDAADATGPTTTDGCTALTNAATVVGKMAFVDRGACAFTVKVANAQAAGAVGVLIGSVAGNPAVPPMGGTDGTITIPSLGVGFSNAEIVRSALAAAGTDTGRLLREAAIERDGTVDAGIVAHEWGHYISNRLVSNASGLSNIQGRGMGEGWGDFHAMLTMVKEGDDLLPNNVDFGGVYTIGSYASTAYYFGIRRYPYSTNMAGVNPLSFRHVSDGVALPVSPAPLFGGDGATNSEVHNTGEVWTAALWECYANLLNDTPRLSFTQARSRMKEYLVGGYKLTPPAPTITEARDGVLASALANDPADFSLCAAGFAKRGLGTLAISPERFDAANAGAVEAFAVAGDARAEAAVVDDSGALACDHDGILDVGETAQLNASITNSGWVSLLDTQATVSADHAGMTFPSGTTSAVADTQPFASAPASFTTALASAPAGGVVTVTVTPADVDIDNPPGTASATRMFVNVDEVSAISATEQFDVRQLAWTTTLASGATPNFAWLRRVTSDRTVASGPDSGSPGLTSLVSPTINVSAGQNFVITFTHRYSFEAGNFDGGVVEISNDNGNTWTDIGNLATNGYTGTLDNTSGNPLGGRQAFVVDSAGYPGYVTSAINLALTRAGQAVKIRFAIGTDAAAGGAGWEIDSVAIAGATNTPFPAVVPEASACDLNAIFKNSFEN